MTIFAPPCPKVVTKFAKLGSSDRCELDVGMVDEAEATPGLSGALLAPVPCLLGREINTKQKEQKPVAHSFNHL